MADLDNKHLFVIQAGVSIKNILTYIQKQLSSGQLIKIITTYDGLCKVLDAADLMTELVNGEPILKSINLLVDEYHLLFTQYCFRDDAIKCILNSFNLFKSYCFLTATPLELDFTLKARFNDAKQRAKKRGIFNNLVITDIYEIWDKQNGKCAISGVTLYISIKV